MYEEREQVSRGLRLLFWAAIISLFSWIPLVGTAAGIVSLYAMYTLSRAASGYKTAFYLSITNLGLSVLGMLFPKGLLGTLVTVAGMVLSLLTVYIICITTAGILQGLDSGLAVRGRAIWKLYAVCTVVMLVCKALSVIPIINIAALLLAVVIAIVQLIANILYLIFLWKSQKLLA